MTSEGERHYRQGIGHVFTLLHLAIVQKEKAQYQPPHWDHEPNSRELACEKEYQEEVAEASKDVEALADQIYMYLTGKRPVKIESDKL